MAGWREQLGACLERQGFAPATRNVVLRTTACGLLAVLIGAALWPAHGWALWFGAATLLSAWNFWGLGKFIHQSISNGWSSKLGLRLIFGSHLRLFLTGFFVYIALVHGKAPLPALLGGLSVSLVFVVISGCCEKA